MVHLFISQNLSLICAIGNFKVPMNQKYNSRMHETENPSFQRPSKLNLFRSTRHAASYKLKIKPTKPRTLGTVWLGVIWHEKINLMSDSYVSYEK